MLLLVMLLGVLRETAVQTTLIVVPSRSMVTARSAGVSGTPAAVTGASK